MNCVINSVLSISRSTYWSRLLILFQEMFVRSTSALIIFRCPGVGSAFIHNELGSTDTSSALEMDADHRYRSANA